MSKRPPPATTNADGSPDRSKRTPANPYTKKKSQGFTVHPSATLLESHRQRDTKKIKVEVEQDNVSVTSVASKQPEKPLAEAKVDDASSDKTTPTVTASQYNQLVRRHKMIVNKLKKEITMKDYQIRVLQANCRQYRMKAINIKQIAIASYTRDEMICEWSSSKMEYGEVNDETKQLSDDEDEKNQVHYSYIDKHADY